MSAEEGFSNHDPFSGLGNQAWVDFELKKSVSDRLVLRTSFATHGQVYHRLLPHLQKKGSVVYGGKWPLLQSAVSVS